LSPPP